MTEADRIAASANVMTVLADMVVIAAEKAGVL